MALTLQIWEDSGTATGTPAHGTTRQEVDNIGWKNSGLDESYPFVDYPLIRPYNGNLYKVSYPKYNYFKIQGTYDYVHNLKIFFEGTPVGAGNGSGVAPNVRILYKWTSTYATPAANTLIDGTFYNPSNPPDMIPLLSTTGPEGTASYITELTSDTTYYTQYLVTQLFVEPGDWNDYGNLNSSFNIKLTMDERKSGLPGYDPDYVNWSW